MENKDRPAFPVTKDMAYTDTGLTKLEEFTKSAMQGILSNPVLMEVLNRVSKDGGSDVAGKVSILAIAQAIDTLNTLSNK